MPSFIISKNKYGIRMCLQDNAIKNHKIEKNYDFTTKIFTHGYFSSLLTSKNTIGPVLGQHCQPCSPSSGTIYFLLVKNVYPSALA